MVTPGDLQTLRASWQLAWDTWQRPAPDALLESLIRAWSQPWRHYHSPQHLVECLSHFERERAHAQQPAEVALALFFHDAVYELRASDNEARSADWARQALQAAGVSAEAAARVHALILATCHSQPADVTITPDAALVVDIDLAILGAAPARFAEYEAQIRREYAHVPPEQFEPARQSVLAHFLACDPLYQTGVMRSRYEAQARANLQRMLGRG